MNEDIIYFSVNNWFSGGNYPDTPNFRKWLGKDSDQYFMKDEWAKENKLCIYAGYIDMSFNYTISAPREWVEANCPELLSDSEYTYETIRYGNGKCERLEHKRRYSDFVDHPDENGNLKDGFGWPYLEYKPENFGVHWYEDPREEDDDEDEEGENITKQTTEPDTHQEEKDTTPKKLTFLEKLKNIFKRK